ncbi:MAG: hypothetical protein RIB30_10010 [Thalassospira sp.]|jgi:hypothetical protein|uniref:hypothetical protein n=1 Tax=Thalassospira sp. TaxID=1912094 RepID=UPI0030ED2CAA|tara:strand:+ start:27162 stop:27380 length:219 start_codon:yes stop_codon:yes gene_type:complete
MNKNNELWVDWLTKYAKIQQNTRKLENFTESESLFDDLVEFTQETWGAREIRPGRQSVTGLLKVSPDQPKSR